MPIGFMKIGDAEQLRRAMTAALARLHSREAANLPELADTIERVEAALYELDRDEPREARIRKGVMVAFVELGRMPDTFELRRSLRALAWQIFGLEYPE